MYHMPLLTPSLLSLVGSHKNSSDACEKLFNLNAIQSYALNILKAHDKKVE